MFCIIKKYSQLVLGIVIGVLLAGATLLPSITKDGRTKVEEPAPPQVIIPPVSPTQLGGKQVPARPTLKLASTSGGLGRLVNLADMPKGSYGFIPHSDIGEAEGKVLIEEGRFVSDTPSDNFSVLINRTPSGEYVILWLYLGFAHGYDHGWAKAGVAIRATYNPIGQQRAVAELPTYTALAKKTLAKADRILIDGSI